MKQFELCFTNTHPFCLSALNSNDAVKRGIEQSRGFLSKSKQRKNLVFCKLKK